MLEDQRVFQFELREGPTPLLGTPRCESKKRNGRNSHLIDKKTGHKSGLWKSEIMRLFGNLPYHISAELKLRLVSTCHLRLSRVVGSYR